ncbi:HBL151Wp [Eremothecium sinecaudum]|uniref:HBL151Wp n=1 Tax=Eremothecium sinecaudum TaxID=45286 RepID=A0A120K0X1_9SACH|nr:HBL151Wp [Eremothecium sinecaudum]AMD18751.1 HBL151Wp [Eremothecium sinecaudum]
MSITSEELNYLIWRYLQEAGHEVSALALQEETRLLEFDEMFKEHIPIGTLVNLVQKGILYTESELLVRYDGEVAPVDKEHYEKDFTLVQALEVDKQRFPELVASGRFALARDSEENKEHEVKAEDEQKEGEDSFIKTLQCIQTFPPGFVSQWNPKNPSMFAWGQKDSSAAVVLYREDQGTWDIQEKFILTHPTTSDKPNEVTCMEWSPSGESLLTGVENGELRLWSAQGKLQNILSYHMAPVVCIKWNPDQTHVLTCDVDNVTIVWNALSGTALQRFNFKEADMSESLGVDITWIDQDKFAIPGLQGSIMIFNIGVNKPMGKLMGHTKTLTTLSYNESNKLLLSASDDLTLRVWRGGNINSAHVFYGHSQSITYAQWVNDDIIISTSMDSTVCLWSLKCNTAIATATISGLPNFTGLLSPDKTKFAVGTMDGEVMVYDVEKLLLKLEEMGGSTKVAHNPLSIPVLGDYQSSNEGSYVVHLCWNQESDELSVSYSLDKVVVLSVR